MSTTDMHFGASPGIFEKAKALRNNMTLAESKLWEKLSKKQLMGLKFRRQHPVSAFIADFYCHALKLVIEVDGKYHDDSEQLDYDHGRTCELNKLGIIVMRFTNEAIIRDINEVLKRVLVVAQKRKQQLYNLAEEREGPPPFRGRGSAGS